MWVFQRKSLCTANATGLCLLIDYIDSELTSHITLRLRRECWGDKMSHPAELLKKYLTELNERIAELEARSDGDIKIVSEAINKLEEKLDNTINVTNQAVDNLYREKLSVQEFREFVDAFNRILGEIFPLFEKHISEKSEKPVFIEPHAEEGSSFEGVTAMALPTESDTIKDIEKAFSSQAVEETATKTIIDSSMSEMEETASLSQGVEKTELTSNVAVREGIDTHVGFPMKVTGEALYVGDGVTLVVGDVEIPPGTTVDETLVVKGNFKSHESCILLNNVKALKNIEIGNDAIVEGTLVSGGRVIVNPNCIVKGSIESDGDIEIGENVIVKRNLASKSSIILNKSAQVLGAVNAAKGVLRS